MATFPKILLIGSQGQVGWELNRLFSPFPHVTAVGRSQLDMEDTEAIQQCLRTLRPQIIFNAAAYTAVDRAESEPELAYRINARAPQTLAREAQALGALLVHYSTDYVFDGTKVGPYIEDDAPNPLNVYGKTKWEGECLIAETGACHLIFRTSWVYGARGRNFLLTIRRLAAERDELKIVDDQIGAPTWCRTIAECSLKAVQSRLGANLDQPVDQIAPLSGTYHLTASGKTSWNGFAKRILEGMSLANPPRVESISTEAFGAPAPRPKNSLLSCEKFEKIFRLTLPSWETALADCQEELQANEN